MTINSYPLIIRAARDGLGVALGWRYLVDSHVARGELVRLPGEPLCTGFGYYLVVPQGRELSAEAETFRAWARRIRGERTGDDQRREA